MEALKLRILLIEDNEYDAEMVRLMIERLGYAHEITRFADGPSALAYLEDSLKKGTPLPNLVLLDIHLEGTNGLDTLAQFKSHPSFQAIPVIVNSNDPARDNVVRTYRQRGAFFLEKSHDPNLFSAIIVQLKLSGDLK